MFEFPLSFYFVEGVSAENLDELFLSKIMSNVDQSHSIIAFEDDCFEAILAEKNISIGDKQVVKLEKKKIEANKIPRKTVLNDSAYEALGMFKSKE